VVTGALVASAAAAPGVAVGSIVGSLLPSATSEPHANRAMGRRRRASLFMLAPRARRRPREHARVAFEIFTTSVVPAPSARGAMLHDEQRRYAQHATKTLAPAEAPVS
jgi:hypothetical protein